MTDGMSFGEVQQGQQRPIVQAVPAQPVSQETVEQSVKSVQKQLDVVQHSTVHLDYDKEIDRVIVKFVNDSTGEMERQIPSEDFVAFQKAFVHTIGLLFDHKA